MGAVRTIEGNYPDITTFNFWKYIKTLTLFLGISFFLILFLLFGKYGAKIIEFLMFFEKSTTVKQYLRSALANFSFSELWPFILGLFIYVSFFEYLRNRKIFAYNQEEKESKYVGFVYYCLGFFNFIIIPAFLIPYLLIGKSAYGEIIFILTFYILTEKLFIPSLKSYTDALHTYEVLEKFQYRTIRHRIKELKILIELNDKDFNAALRNRMNLLINSAVLYFLVHIFIIQSVIFAFTFIIPFFGLMLNFNLLSIFYSIISLALWFLVLCILSMNFPQHKIKMKLIDGTTISDVYLIEDHPKYCLILTKKNELITIMRDAIITIKKCPLTPLKPL